MNDMEKAAMESLEQENEPSSPDHVRLSLAAAMTLGFKSGLFYRGAKLRCINLLETYPGGCVGMCAYCGLARDRKSPAATTEGEKSGSFIRVTWPTLSLDEVIEAMVERPEAYDRVCISMVSRKRATADVVTIAERLRHRLPVPISVLLTPTYVDLAGLERIREAGVDRLGIAIDAATPELFDQLRGKSAGGPHRWERYWEGLAEAASVFGEGMAGCHLIVGVGETEAQMVETLLRVRRIGCVTHLFSFFPEAGSSFESRPQPPVGQYRRIQLARYLIDEGLVGDESIEFDCQGVIRGFGLDPDTLDEVIASGTPFRTSGCPGESGEVACNRPFANCRPGPELRNYPFALEPEDLERVRSELWPLA